MRVLQEQNSVKVQIFVEVQKKCYDSILLDTTQKQSRPFISSKRYNTRFKTKYGFLQNNQTWLINKKVNNIKNDDLPIGVFLWIKVERKIYNPKLKPENMWSNNYTKKVEVGVLVLWYFFLFDFENFLSDVERFKEKKKKKVKWQWQTSNDIMQSKVFNLQHLNFSWQNKKLVWASWAWAELVWGIYDWKQSYVLDCG